MTKALKQFLKIGVWLVIFIGVGIAQISGQNIPSKPNPPRLVNDFANILTAEQRSHLEQMLVAYDDSSSIQVALVTVNSLDGAGIDDYAIALGREWGVGNKSTNNGVVVLLSLEQGKRGVFIAPGYGLEAALSDYTCKSIIDGEMLPQFKQGNYYRGLEQGIDAILSAARGKYTAPEGYENRGKGKGGGKIFFLILLMILVFIFIGGRGGGGGGDAMTRRGHRHVGRVPPFLFFPPIGGGGGGGGGGWSGGGGGFGGFGGGGFGGGGAGGSW
jgi:uncharacterized protein